MEPNDNKYDDGLRVQQFTPASPIKFTAVNPETPNKITKNSKNGKGWKLVAIGVSVVIVGGVLNSAIYSQTHEQVLHDLDGDYIDGDSILHHGHELTEEYFVKDYKFVNPLANNADINEAIKNGDYDEYQNGNKGGINIESKLQDDRKIDSAYYNNDCKEFFEEYQEQESIRASK